MTPKKKLPNSKLPAASTAIVIFAIGYALCVIGDLMCASPFVARLRTILMLLSFAAFATGVILRIKLDELSLKSPRVVAILAAAVGVTLVTRNYSLARLVLSIMAIPNLDDKKRFNLVAFDCILRALVISGLLALYIAGATVSDVVLRGQAYRFSFGFVHPNSFAIACLMICFDLFVIFADKATSYKLTVSVVAVGFSYVIFTGAMSRTAALLIIAGLVVMWCSKYQAKIYKKRIVCYGAQLLLPFFTILSIVIGTLGKSNLGTNNFLNKALSGRPYLYSDAISKYGTSILGRPGFKDDYASGAALPLDNAFLMLIINFGLIALSVYAVLSALSVRQAIGRSNYTSVSYYLLTLCLGLFESSFLYVQRNPYLLLYKEALDDKWN